MRPDQDFPSQDLPSQDLPSQDLPSQDLPSQDLPSQDLPSQDLPSQDLPDREPPIRAPRGYDVVIVGARAAGAATALHLARLGARVLVVDRDSRGSDTLSTHALMRPAVALLHRWGVLDAVAAAGAPAVRRIAFHYGDEIVELPVKPKDGVEGLYAPRRRVLDRLLVEAALQAGADFRFGVTLDDLERAPDGRVSGVCLRDRAGRAQTVSAGLVIGADGRCSTVARLVEAEETRVSERRTATLYGYFAGIPDQGFRWFYRPGLGAGALPTNDGAHCVFACVPPERLQSGFGQDPLAGLIAAVEPNDPELAEAMRIAGPQERLRRFGGAPGHFRRSHGPGWALVGDAGYFKDPVTAHGLTDALRDAEALARHWSGMAPGAAVSTDERMAAYERERDARSEALFAATDAIAGLDWDLDTLKALHARVYQAMKDELAEIAAAPRLGRMAA